MSIRLLGQRPLRGTVRPVSDKSISHRALMLAAMAEGKSVIHQLNDGEDVKATQRCLRQMGVHFEEQGSTITVSGRSGKLRCPTDVLDCGNSGTSMRLLAGVLASQDFTATLDGDESLRGRPMRRIALPLRGPRRSGRGPRQRRACAAHHHRAGAAGGKLFFTDRFGSDQIRGIVGGSVFRPPGAD